MVNETMFKELCEEVHKSGWNVLKWFAEVVKGWQYLGWEEIELKAKYIIENYGD